MEKTKKFLYSYAKERYLWEHSRKNELNSSVTIPLGILIVQITSFSYFLLNFPKKACNGIFISFIIFFILSILSIILSIILFMRHQSGYKYAYILSPTDMENYRGNYIAAYTDNNDIVDYKYIYNELKETEFSEYLEATERNILNNETKIKFYRYLLLSLIVSTTLLVFTLFFSLLLDKNIELIRVFIEQSIE
jgi:uncharacterized Tic20 family protein